MNEESIEAGVAGPRTAPGAQVVHSARAHVEQLLAAFLADPHGEAGQMTRTLLFNYMVKEQTQQEAQTLRELQEHQRKHAVLVEDVETLAVSGLNARTRGRELAEALRQARSQQAAIQECVREGQKASAEKKPFDYERALKQISEVIGVGRPLKHLVPSKVEGTPNYHLTREELRDFEHGRGPAWEEEQRRKRERDKKPSMD